jgi:O-succinylbenzoate synthase
MIIDAITLHEIRMPLVSYFETSFGRTDERRILLVEVRADGESGWSEVTAGETPFYSHETTDTAAHIIRDFAAPMVLGKRFEKPSELQEMMKLIRGHQMARAAVENAVWALQSEVAGQPLWQSIGGTRREIPCGVSIGIKATVADLLAAIEKEVDAGYQRIKIKIKPGWDTAVIEQVRRSFPATPLMGDANSAYTLADTAHLQELDRFNLMMLEQPLWHDDIYFHAQLQKKLRTPICLDEAIKSVRDAQQAIELGACRIINMKLGRVGGFTSALEIHELTRQHGIPVWCGGMLESGVGRAHNIAMSTLENFTLPGDVSASKRYWQEDIVDPPVEVTPRGTIEVPIQPGLGYRVKTDLIRRLTVWEHTVRSPSSMTESPHSSAMRRA